MDGICRANVGNDKSIENVKIEKNFFLCSNRPKDAFVHIKKKEEKKKKRIANLLLLTAV